MPSRTTALSFLEPITAPRPERAASLPLSLLIPEMRESLSPAGPIVAILAPTPNSFFSASSVSTVSLPHNPVASLSSALPFLTNSSTGFSLIPLKKIPSYPHRLMAGENDPPQFASPHPPVSGDLPTTIHLPENRLPVPVRRPDTNPRILSGPRGSAPAGILLYKRWAARPDPDRYLS